MRAWAHQDAPGKTAGSLLKGPDPRAQETPSVLFSSCAPLSPGRWPTFPSQVPCQFQSPLCKATESYRKEKIAPIGVPWSSKVFLSLLPFPFHPLPLPLPFSPHKHTALAHSSNP